MKMRLDIRNQGIELHTLTNLERADLHLANGRMLLKLKQYEKATKHYDASFKLAKYEEFLTQKDSTKSLKPTCMQGVKKMLW